MKTETENKPRSNAAPEFCPIKVTPRATSVHVEMHLDGFPTLFAFIKPNVAEKIGRDFLRFAKAVRKGRAS